MNTSIKNELVITRIFDAPRELVWKAWTDPERLRFWWGPKGLPVTVHKFELKPGGIFHYSMRTPDGTNWWGRFVYSDIKPVEKIIFVNSFSDENCGITRHPLSASWPLEVYNTLTLIENENKTTLTLSGYPVNASKEEIETFTSNFASVQRGFKGTFDQLDEYLSNLSKDYRNEN